MMLSSLQSQQQQQHIYLELNQIHNSQDSVITETQGLVGLIVEKMEQIKLQLRSCEDTIAAKEEEKLLVEVSFV